MFLRDPWTTAIGPVQDTVYAGPSLGQADQTQNPVFWYSQLRAISHAIADNRRRAETAYAAGNTAQANAAYTAVEILRDNFAYVAEQFTQTGAASDPDRVSGFSLVLATVGMWLAQFAKAPLDVVRAVPVLVVDAAGDVVKKTATDIVLPLILVGAAVLYGVTRAERTRTYTRYVA